MPRKQVRTASTLMAFWRREAQRKESRPSPLSATRCRWERLATITSFGLSSADKAQSSNLVQLDVQLQTSCWKCIVLNLILTLCIVLLFTRNQMQVMRRNRVGYEVGEEGRKQRARDAHLLGPDLQSPSPVSNSMCQNMYVCILKSIMATNVILNHSLTVGPA